MIQKTVIGVFSDRDDAEDAIASLKQEDYNPKDISIVMQSSDDSQQLAHSTGTNVVGGAATGATTGAVIGGIAGLLVGVGALAIPGFGALLIGGPLATALGLTGAAATTASGAATGAVAGGVIGALMGLGVPEEDAQVYAERVRTGGILLAVPARVGEEEDVRELMEDNDADTIRVLTLRDSVSNEDVDYEDAEVDDSTEDGQDYYSSPRHTYTSSEGVLHAGRKGGRSRIVERKRRTVRK